MITLISRLCALCAMSALMQLTLPERTARGSLRAICGLLMLHLTLSGICSLGAALGAQRDLAGIFACLME